MLQNMPGVVEDLHQNSSCVYFGLIIIGVKVICLFLVNSSALKENERFAYNPDRTAEHMRVKLPL